MSRRDEWQKVLDAEVQLWSAKSCDELMSELRETHLGAPARRRPKSGHSVAARLQAAYDAVVAKRKTPSA